MNPNYETEIKELRQKLKNKDLSILVGAGFSKNVHSKLFLSWGELLDKMVRRMNVRNYAAAYERQTGKKPKDTNKKYQSYIQDQVNQYLEQTDYLQVVSNYIKKMGYRETVDVCIEESIPRAILENGKTILLSKENGKPTKTEINPSDLYVHHKLLMLPWNNIYTTNYDNLLEFCINKDTISGLETQILDYKCKIEQLGESIRQKAAEGERLLTEIQTVEAAISPNIQLGPDDAEDGTLSEKHVNDKITKLSNQRYGINYQIMQAEQEINDLTKRKLKLEEALVDSYVVVKHSSRLAIKRNRNIIKLHGSLPDDEDDLFAFDNEYDKRYIISQEDYEHYPVRHEAFTQLMRISLLQGYFCLIGFSGDDPNFMAWISWVRSVIMRNSTDKQQETKIYFLDARSSSAPDPHKMQFYKNHRISYIPLSHPDCISFLRKELKRRIVPTDTKSLLGAVMDYFAHISIPDRSQISYEIMKRERYVQLWAGMRKNLSVADDDDTSPNICRHYDELKKLKQYNRIPQFSDQANQQKHWFLSSIRGAKETDSETEEETLGLIALALEDLFVPYSVIIEEADFRRLYQRAKALSPELYRRYLRQDLKDAIWCTAPMRAKKLRDQLSNIGPGNDLDDCIHLLLMEAAVNFNFSELKKVLEKNAGPVGASTTLAGYWFYFASDVGVKMLKDRNPGLAQEQVYTLGMLRILGVGDDNSKINEKYQQLKHEGLNLLEDNLKYAISQLRAKTKFEPFEDNSVLSRSFSMDNSGRSLLGFQTLGMMLEVGLPLSGNGYYFQDKHDMHPLFLQVFEQFPLPVLFFALQFTEKKYIKRVAQDFTFSEDIAARSGEIFAVLFRAYEDVNTPHWYKSNILTFLSEFVNVLAPVTWHPLLLKVWIEKHKENTLFHREIQREIEFIESGLRFCQDAEIIATVITDCLQSVVKDSSTINSANHYLYRIASNPYHKSLKNEIRKRIDAGVLNGIVDMIVAQPDHLFIVGNLHTFLNPNQVKHLEEKLSEINYQAIAYSNLWSVAVHYSGQQKKTQRKIIDELLKSPMLWQTGMSMDGNGKFSYRDTNNYIPIRRLTKGKGAKGLTFTKGDVKKIYSKIPLSLEAVAKVLQDGPIWSDGCFALLQEMSWFLEAEAGNLKTESDYQQIKEEVIRLAFNGNKDLHILSGLANDDSNMTNRAVTEVAVALYDREEFRKHNGHIKLMIDKILLKKGSGIMLCLEYIVAWCKHFKNTEHLKPYTTDLFNILILYKEAYPSGLQIPRLEELLVELALALKLWGYENEAVAYFVSRLDSSRFINIKFNLKENVKQR